VARIGGSDNVIPPTAPFLRQKEGTRPIEITSKPSQPIVSQNQLVITYIATDPEIVRKMATPSGPPVWQRLDDDELLNRLAEIGQPRGLAEVDGRQKLVLLEPQGAAGGI